MRWILVPLLAVASCTGSKARYSADSAKPKAASSGSQLVLYSDKALLRYTTPVEFAADGTAWVYNIPVGNQTMARMSDTPLAVEHGLQLDGSARFEALNGAKVMAIGEDSQMSGRIVEWTYRGLVLATEQGVAMFGNDVEALIVETPSASLMPGELFVRGGKQGTHPVEVQTWLDGLAWRVAYTIVLDGPEAESALLQGWLAVDSSIAQPFSVENIAIVDGRSEKPPEVPQWNRYRYGQPLPPEPTAQPRAPIAVLDRGAEVRAGGSIRLPLFGNARRTKVTMTRVFDPVGPSLAHEGATPVFRRNYGTANDGKSIPISLSVQLDLPADELERLPAGEVSLFSRTAGIVRAVGATRGFGQPASQKADLITDEKSGVDAKKEAEAKVAARPGELRIGVAPGLSGKRWQEDFHLDKAQKRIVEEIRVELKNDSDEPARVVVHEHLYRGLNWSLAYHNGIGVATKAAPQEVRFNVTVPAKDKALVMYRVVYTW